MNESKSKGSTAKESRNVFLKRFLIHVLTAIVAAIVAALLGVIATFYFPDIHLFILKHWAYQDEYSSYFADLDGSNQYISCDGTFRFRKKFHKDRCSIRGVVDGSIRLSGKWYPGSWEIRGFMPRNGLYLGYDTGIGILRKERFDYTGYWIGKSGDPAKPILICPWVFSKYSWNLSEERAKGEWKILRQPCRACKSLDEALRSTEALDDSLPHGNSGRLGGHDTDSLDKSATFQ